MKKIKEFCKAMWDHRCHIGYFGWITICAFLFFVLGPLGVTASIFAAFVGSIVLVAISEVAYSLIKGTEIGLQSLIADAVGILLSAFFIIVCVTI